MFRHVPKVTCLVLFVMLLCACAAAQDAARPRIGWEESFDDISRWKTALLNPRGSTPMTEVKAVDGCIDFTTPVGALNRRMKRADWPEWPKDPGSSFTNWAVDYDDVVDFDVYRYLVIRIPEKSTFFYVSIRGKGLKVAYTTGVHAQDLKSLGLTGKQRVRFYCQTLNTHGHVKIDYIRLVNELTDEEKKGFIDDGLTIRAEKQTSHPYHGLDAMNARAGRPNRTGNENTSEWLVYRDSGTGAEIWKMTDLATNEHQVSFNSDGSAFTVHGRPGEGFHIFDWSDHKFKLIEGGLRDARPRFSTTEPDAMIIAENTWLTRTATSRPRKITIWRQNFRTGKKTAIASFEPKTWRVQEFSSSPDSSKMTFGLRESPVVFLIDPEKAPGERVREIKLTTRLKGARLANNDTEIHWNNCYTYQGLMMDLKTGRVSQANRCTAGGHSAGGPHWTIGPYGQLMKLLVKNGVHPQTEATADDVRIFANYAEPVVTDYGHVSSNGKWMVTNGARGDVAGQHLMIAINDPATVLRTCFYNTSRNDWVTNTYARTSPDTTKLAWVSDQFDDGDVYLAITGRPAPPTELKAVRVGRNIKLTWKAPDAKENGGYRVYRSDKSGKGFIALNRTPVDRTTYEDKIPSAGPLFYLVAMVEPSGLEGSFTNEAAVPPIGSRVWTVSPPTHFIEAEDCEWSAPMRLVLHGGASGSRYLRYHKAAATEPDEGTMRWTPDAPRGATVWMRCRNEAKGEGWRWKKTNVDAASKTMKIREDGFAIDQIAITNDPAFDPLMFATGGPHTAPSGSLTGLEVAEIRPQSIRLKWKSNPEKNIARYDIHVAGQRGVKPALGNATIIGSTKDTQFLDWGLRPGTKYAYHVVAFDTRGKRSGVARVEVTTAAQTIQKITAVPSPLPPGEGRVREDAGGLVKAAEKITYTIEVKEKAPFMAWVKYRPAYVPTKSLRVTVEIDGKPAGTWPLRAPYRPMSWVLASRGKGVKRVFVDKLVADGKDVFTLARGKHTITLTCVAAPVDEQHAFSAIVLTNDHSFRPEGYDPRANFHKRTR